MIDYEKPSPVKPIPNTAVAVPYDDDFLSCHIAHCIHASNVTDAPISWVAHRCAMILLLRSFRLTSMRAEEAMSCHSAISGEIFFSAGPEIALKMLHSILFEHSTLFRCVASSVGGLLLHGPTGAADTDAHVRRRFTNSACSIAARCTH